MRFRASYLIDTYARPEKAGREFAQALLDQKLTWDNLQIQITGIRATTLISTFWSAFKKELEEKAPGLLPDIKNVEWICDQEFQEEDIRKWLA